MVWQPTLFSVSSFGAATISLIIVSAAYLYEADPITRPFVFLMLVLSGWSFSYAVLLGFTTVQAQLLWQQIVFAISGTVPPVWLLFTLEYAQMTEWLTRRRETLLALPSLAFAFLTFTNPAHHLIWRDATLAAGAEPRVVLLTFGIGYYLFVVYAYLIIITGIGVLVLVLRRTTVLYRKQASALIVGALPPYVAHLAFVLQVDVGPLPALDVTPFSFAITGVLFSLALFQFDLLERTPVAQRQVLSEMGDGIIVLDVDGTIVDINPIARRIIEPTPAVGDTIEEGLSVVTGTPATDLDTIHGRTITATVNSARRVYDVKVSSLTDQHGKPVGAAIALRDVTEREAHQQRLDVTQRVLRHNLRNDLNVIHGWAEQLAESTTESEAEAAQRIIDASDKLVDLADKTRQLASVDTFEYDRPEQVDVTRLLTDRVDESRRTYPDATIDSEIAPAVEAALPNEELLAIALRNLIENAIEHNDAAEPWVNVRLDETDEAIRIQVVDDGPGIPEMETEVLEEGVETPLKHGSGIGLWLTYWCVTMLNGTISFENRTPAGSIVTVELPISQ